MLSHDHRRPILQRSLSDFRYSSGPGIYLFYSIGQINLFGYVEEIGWLFIAWLKRVEACFPYVRFPMVKAETKWPALEITK